MSKHLKVKSLGERNDFFKNIENLNFKKYESEAKKFHNSDALSKKRINNGLSYKLKIEENFRKEKYETPKNAKGRRGSRFDIFITDKNFKNNILLTVKREKENIAHKNFSTNLTNILDKHRDKLEGKDKVKNKEKIKEKKRDRNKDKNKEIIKDKNHDSIKSKEKEKENDNNNNTYNLKMSTRTKKEKKKSKKKDKNKTKEKDISKEKNGRKKFSAKILKLLLIKPKKENKGDDIIRRDKSKTQIYRPQNNYLAKTSTKRLKVFQSVNLSSKNHYFENNFSLKRMNSRDKALKRDYQINLGDSTTFHRPGRRNSTRTMHFKSQQEKITEYTNKQNIDNINEYTRQCLDIIPDLYALKEMPRCKNKVHPTFTKTKSTKKIALFDLDETIIHCIGEINMNNVESFSRQSDAKIKVLLPGGKQVIVGINIRPHWEEALNIIKDKYHIIAYTASHESYADSVINYLDPENKYFEYRLYRSHCVLCIVFETISPDKQIHSTIADFRGFSVHNEIPDQNESIKNNYIIGLRRNLHSLDLNEEEQI